MSNTNEKQSVNKPEEKKVEQKKSSKHVGLTLIALLLLAAGSGVAVYYMTPIVLSSLAPAKPIVTPIKKAEATVLEPQLVVQVEEVPTNDTVIFKEESLELSEDEFQEVVVSENENLPLLEAISDEPKALALEDPEPTEQKLIVTKPTEPKPVTTQPKVTPPYSVLKAMELKEAFKNGGDCRSLLEELVALPNKTPEMEQALMELLQACLDRPIGGQMQQAFQQAKKRAILRIFQNDSPTYLAYLKALPYFLADVRKKNPSGDAPLEVLNQVQDAVEADRPQLVLNLIQKLPENVKATLNDVTQYAEIESQLYRNLNRLMKALFDGEDGE